MLNVIYFINKFGKQFMALLAVLVGYFFIKKTNKLQVDKSLVEKELEEAKKVINVQNKVIKAKNNIKPTNLKGVTNWMRQNKL